MKKILTPVIIIILGGCGTSLRISEYWTSIKKQAINSKAMVVSAHPLASNVGIDVIKRGGNAVDAAIAVQLALAVVYPRAGNLGGGGFMVYRSASGMTNTLDYREKAPAAAHRDMYLDTHGNPTRLSIEGHLASGVPGTVAGLVESHKKYGHLSWDKLIIPAIELAEKGFSLTTEEANRLNGIKPLLEKYNGANAFIKPTKWQQGDVLIQKELAWTLRQIKAKGHQGFYEGDVAAKIVAEMKSANGIITSEDLLKYKAIWRKPIQSKYKEYNIISMAPPSSGGIALSQLLKIIEPYPIATWGFRDPRTVHLMVEAERRVYADRSQYLGDADYVHVPADTLLDPTYLKYRMTDFNPDQATASTSIYAGNFKMALEHFETTHLSIVDVDGNAVSITTTLNGNYGNKVIVDGAGFFMNNEMDDFSAKPGTPNMFGLIGAEANSIQPGKRMLSSMTPTIVEKNGQLHMVLGSPGGSTIITSVFQVFLNVAEWNMSMSEAVAAGRFHHQWLPDEIMTESKSFDAATKATLVSKGHKFRDINSIGLVDAILVRPDKKLEGGADPRSDDHAAGW